MRKVPSLSQTSPTGLVVGRTIIAPADVCRLVLVMFLWALCYPLIATGLSQAPPLTFAALRSLAAGIGLLLPAILIRRPFPRGKWVWLGLLGVGFSSTSLGFAGMFLAGGVVSPGLATVLANVQPLIAAGLAYIVLRERLGPRRKVGLLLAFVGILVIAWPSPGGSNANSGPAGLAYVMLSATGVAVGNVLFKRLARQTDPLMAAGGQFVLGAVPLLLAARVFEGIGQVVWSPSFVVVLLALGLFGTALAFGLWFSLLRRGELTRLNTFTFLTPVIALVIARLFYGEVLHTVELGGILLILAGVSLVI